MTCYLVAGVVALVLAAVAGIVFDSLLIFLVVLPPQLLFAFMVGFLCNHQRRPD